MAGRFSACIYAFLETQSALGRSQLASEYWKIAFQGGHGRWPSQPVEYLNACRRRASAGQRPACHDRKDACLPIASAGTKLMTRVAFVLSQTREYPSPRKWHRKILRTRNSDSLINADVLGDENEHSSADIARDPFLRSASAADTRCSACRTSRMG